MSIFGMFDESNVAKWLACLDPMGWRVWIPDVHQWWMIDLRDHSRQGPKTTTKVNNLVDRSLMMALAMFLR